MLRSGELRASKKLGTIRARLAKTRERLHMAQKPLSTEEGPTTVVGARLPPSELAQLDELVSLRNMRRSDLLREALQKLVAAHELGKVATA